MLLQSAKLIGAGAATIGLAGTGAGIGHSLCRHQPALTADQSPAHESTQTAPLLASAPPYMFHLPASV